MPVFSKEWGFSPLNQIDYDWEGKEAIGGGVTIYRFGIRQGTRAFGRFGARGTNFEIFATSTDGINKYLPGQVLISMVEPKRGTYFFRPGSPLSAGYVAEKFPGLYPADYDALTNVIIPFMIEVIQ